MSAPDDSRGRGDGDGWLRRLFRRSPRLTWHDRHPLPAGWRPRTRIDRAGREVEPWGWLICDPRGHAHDGGEWWLPVGRDPDQAAHEILEHWLSTGAGYLDPWELPGLRCSARRAGLERPRVGVAFAAEQSLTR